jgi:hypothetical protein
MTDAASQNDNTRPTSNPGALESAINLTRPFDMTQLGSQFNHSNDQGWTRVPLEFLRSAAYSGLQTPVNGVVQIVDHYAHTDILPSVQFVNAPAEASFGSFDWHVQQLGNAAGIAVPFFFLNKGVGAVLGRAGTAATVGLTNELTLGSVLRPVGQAALTGAIFDGVFRPVSPEQGNFERARFNNAVTGGATFGTLTLGTVGLGAMGMRSQIAAGILSGLPAGAVSAEVGSLMAGRGHASWNDIGESAYGFAFVGGSLGAVHSIESRIRGNSAERSDQPSQTFRLVNGQAELDAFRTGQQPAAWLTVRQVAEAGLIRRVLGMEGRLGPEQTMSVQHSEQGAIPDPYRARMADLSVYCDPQLNNFGGNHIFADGTGPVWMENTRSGDVRFTLGERAPSPEATRLATPPANPKEATFDRLLSRAAADGAPASAYEQLYGFLRVNPDMDARAGALYIEQYQNPSVRRALEGFYKPEPSTIYDLTLSDPRARLEFDKIQEWLDRPLVRSNVRAPEMLRNWLQKVATDPVNPRDLRPSLEHLARTSTNEQVVSLIDRALGTNFGNLMQFYNGERALPVSTQDLRTAQDQARYVEDVASGRIRPPGTPAPEPRPGADNGLGDPQSILGQVPDDSTGSPDQTELHRQALQARAATISNAVDGLTDPRAQQRSFETLIRFLDDPSAQNWFDSWRRASENTMLGPMLNNEAIDAMPPDVVRRFLSSRSVNDDAYDSPAKILGRRASLLTKTAESFANSPEAAARLLELGAQNPDALSDILYKLGHPKEGETYRAWVEQQALTATSIDQLAGDNALAQAKILKAFPNDPAVAAYLNRLAASGELNLDPIARRMGHPKFGEEFTRIVKERVAANAPAAELDGERIFSEMMLDRMMANSPDAKQRLINLAGGDMAALQSLLDAPETMDRPIANAYRDLMIELSKSANSFAQLQEIGGALKSGNAELAFNRAKDIRPTDADAWRRIQRLLYAVGTGDVAAIPPRPRTPAPTDNSAANNSPAQPALPVDEAARRLYLRDRINGSGAVKNAVTNERGPDGELITHNGNAAQDGTWRRKVDMPGQYTRYEYKNGDVITVHEGGLYEVRLADGSGFDLNWPSTRPAGNGPAPAPADQSTVADNSTANPVVPTPADANGTNAVVPTPADANGTNASVTGGDPLTRAAVDTTVEAVQDGNGTNVAATNGSGAPAPLTTADLLARLGSADMTEQSAALAELRLRLNDPTTQRATATDLSRRMSDPTVAQWFDAWRDVAPNAINMGFHLESPAVQALPSDVLMRFLNEPQVVRQAAAQPEPAPAEQGDRGQRGRGRDRDNNRQQRPAPDTVQSRLDLLNRTFETFDDPAVASRLIELGAADQAALRDIIFKSGHPQYGETYRQYVSDRIAQGETNLLALGSNDAMNQARIVAAFADAPAVGQTLAAMGARGEVNLDNMLYRMNNPRLGDRFRQVLQARVEDTQHPVTAADLAGDRIYLETLAQQSFGSSPETVRRLVDLAGDNSRALQDILNGPRDRVLEQAYRNLIQQLAPQAENIGQLQEFARAIKQGDADAAFNQAAVIRPADPTAWRNFQELMNAVANGDGNAVRAIDRRNRQAAQPAVTDNADPAQTQRQPVPNGTNQNDGTPAGGDTQRADAEAARARARSAALEARVVSAFADAPEFGQALAEAGRDGHIDLNILLNNMNDRYTGETFRQLLQERGTDANVDGDQLVQDINSGKLALEALAKRSFGFVQNTANRIVELGASDMQAARDVLNAPRDRDLQRPYRAAIIALVPQAENIGQLQAVAKALKAGQADAAIAAAREIRPTDDYTWTQLQHLLTAVSAGDAASAEQIAPLLRRNGGNGGGNRREGSDNRGNGGGNRGGNRGGNQGRPRSSDQSQPQSTPANPVITPEVAQEIARLQAEQQQRETDDRRRIEQRRADKKARKQDKHGGRRGGYDDDEWN